MAHRGASAHAPENTLEAFDLAVCQGANVLELDVRLTLDGQVVVSHDAVAQRMCQSPLATRLSTWAELAKLDAAAGFVSPSGANPFVGRGVRMARLVEVLHHFGSVGLNIDLKEALPELVEKTVRSVAESGHKHTLLTGFAKQTWEQLHALKPPAALGLCETEARAAVIRARLGLNLGRWSHQALQVPATFMGLPTLGQAAIGRLRQANIPVHFWVVNTPAVAQRLLAQGADGIITDDPGALAQVLPPTVRGKPRRH